jgi:hypothetical protein
MRLARVADGIQAGDFALAQRGPDAPTAGPALSGAGKRTAHAHPDQPTIPSGKEPTGPAPAAPRMRPGPDLGHRHARA